MQLRSFQAWTPEHLTTPVQLYRENSEIFGPVVIHGATGQMPSTSHNLSDLADQVKKVAPKIAMEFSSPFGFDNVPIGLDAKALEKSIGNEPL